jgi:PKD repeat protein
MLKYLFLGILLLSLIMIGSAAVTETTTTNGDYTIVKYNGTGSTTWTAPDGVTSVRVLVVAGGGGGGGTNSGSVGGGGGGAGGLVTDDDYTVSPGTEYDVIVGDGGTGNTASAGSNGQDTEFDALAATAGGGGGGTGGYTGKGGGSGGGGAGTGGSAGGAGTPGQGSNGGAGASATPFRGGGGGGASETGYTGAASGNGGGGTSSDITGSPVTYAGGGGSGGYTSYGAGGSGGGGNGKNGGAGNPGTNDLGGGGGGTRSNGNAGGKGGSGVVILNYTQPIGDPPVAEFSADEISGVNPLHVHFTDESTNSPDTWAWDIDNDGDTDYTTQNPEHTYTSGGLYTVNLTVTNEIGSDSEIKADYIEVIDPPVSDFSANVTTGYVPLTVHFTDESTNSPTSWAWDIDNDGDTDYTTQNPDHTYSSPGYYTVKLTATNTAGSDSETKINYIDTEHSPTPTPTIPVRTTIPTTAHTTAVPESLEETMGHVQTILPNFINMVSAAIPGFLVIGVVMVVIGLFSNLKGVMNNLLRRRKW